MLLKLLVYGPFGYIKNPYNIFDGVIVVIRYDCPFLPLSGKVPVEMAGTPSLYFLPGLCLVLLEPGPLFHLPSLHLPLVLKPTWAWGG